MSKRWVISKEIRRVVAAILIGIAFYSLVGEDSAAITLDRENRK